MSILHRLKKGLIFQDTVMKIKYYGTSLLLFSKIIKIFSTRNIFLSESFEVIDAKSGYALNLE